MLRREIRPQRNGNVAVLRRDDVEQRIVRHLLRALGLLLAASGAQAAPPSAADFGLTDRQTDVLALLMEGKSNKQISRELDLAEATVTASRVSPATRIGAVTVTVRGRFVTAVNVVPSP